MMRRPITGGGELAQRLLEVQLLEQLFLYPQWHPAGKSGSHVGRWRDRFPIGARTSLEEHDIYRRYRD